METNNKHLFKIRLAINDWDEYFKDSGVPHEDHFISFYDAFISGNLIAQHRLRDTIKERNAKIAELEIRLETAHKVIELSESENQALKSELDKAKKLLALDGQNRRLALREINNLLHGINES